MNTRGEDDKPSMEITSPEDEAADEADDSMFEEDYTLEIMKRLEFKDQAEFKKYIIRNTRVLSSFMALLEVKNPTQAVFVVLFELLRHKFISRKKFMEAMIYFKEQRNKILVDNGIDLEALPENAVIVVKHDDEDANKKGKNKYDMMYE